MVRCGHFQAAPRLYSRLPHARRVVSAVSGKEEGPIWTATQDSGRERQIRDAETGSGDRALRVEFMESELETQPQRGLRGWRSYGRFEEPLEVKCRMETVPHRADGPAG